MATKQKAKGGYKVMFKNNVFNASVDTKQWLKATGVRAVKTMAQTAVAMLPAMATITEVDWLVVGGTAALAGIASVMTSVAGLPEVKYESEGK